VASGLDTPTAIAFAPDGRYFVAERGGVVVEYDAPTDSTPTTVVDLSTQVHSVGDRGLLSLAVHPQFPTRPYIYTAYMVDAQPGGSVISFYHDTCPLSPSGAKDGCPAAGRLSRILVDQNTDQAHGPEQILIGGTYWCHQQQAHAVDHIAFGPDGALYITSGEGATTSFTDWGQHSGAPDAIVAPNACGDPPAPAGTPLSPPTTEGGALPRPPPPRVWAGRRRRVERSGRRTCARAATRPRAAARSPGSIRIPATRFPTTPPSAAESRPTHA